jgi:TP901 family phage tail tape measure protein
MSKLVIITSKIEDSARNYFADCPVEVGSTHVVLPIGFLSKFIESQELDKEIEIRYINPNPADKVNACLTEIKNALGGSSEEIEKITAAINKFASEVLESNKILEGFSGIRAKFFVTEKELEEAIRRVGSSAEEAGVSFDELISLVEEAQKISARGGAIIGNALKTIFTRLQREDVQKELCWLGIKVAKGNRTGAVEILKDLAIKFDSLEEKDQQNILELLGGVFQMSILKAILVGIKS